MSDYAKGTVVSRAKSQAELQELLERFKAKGFLVGQDERAIMVAFQVEGRNVRFRLALPERNDRRFTHTPVTKGARSPASAAEAYEAELRRIWRALVLAIKAKLVSVEEGIETFEEAFLAHVMMPDGQTVHEHIKPRLAIAYESGEVPPLLPPPRYQGDA